MRHYHEPDLRGLENYAETDRQRLYIETCRQAGNIAHAAKELNVSERSLRKTLSRLRTIRDAAEEGVELPGTKHLLPGQKIKGVSVLTRTEDGDPIWLKTAEDKQKLEDELAEMRAAFADSLPRERVIKPNKGKKDDELLNLYVVTDYHIGMRSWPEETGADWDTAIAEDLLVRWFITAIRSAPRSGTAVLAQLGDFLHWDGIEAINPTSKHVLDADTRFQKLVRVAIRVTRRVVRELLRRHDKVHVLMAEGNHDLTGSMWLRELFEVLYEDEPRVTVEISPDPYYCYEFGKVSLFFHHGHLRKQNKIDDVFVSKFRPVFGRTKFSYGHMGHLHHDKVLETFLMHIEQHQTLAAPDAYASRGGWMSGRSAKVITYHKNHGEIRRETITPEML